MKKFFPLLLCILMLNACVFHKLGKDDNLSSDTSDSGIKSSVMASLKNKDPNLAEKLNVFVFNRNVFLVGESPESFRKYALDVAKNTKGVTGVTPHWFPDNSGKRMQDAAIAAEIDSKVLFDTTLSSSRMGVEVWGGHVLLLGLMDSQTAIDQAIAIARSEKGVKSVTSYLMKR